MIRPLTAEMLAERWLVSPETVRQLCKRGGIHAFRVGRMFRIPMDAILEYEACQNIVSESSEVDLPSHGGKTENVDAIVLLHSRPRTQNAKL